MDEETSEEPMEEESAMGDEGDDPAAQTFGAACGEVPADGAGSFVGMATEPVANAASANPLLSTLVAAVTAADLVDTLNSADGITVFAPANPAFDAFSKKQLNGLLKDKETLTAVLTHHVVAGQLSPDDLAGEHETLNGDMVTVEGLGRGLHRRRGRRDRPVRQRADRQRDGLHHRHRPDAVLTMTSVMTDVPVLTPIRQD